MFNYLKGKTALITGASSGIGREFALQLADRGCNLVIASRNVQQLELVANMINETYQSERNIEVIEADLEKQETPREIFEHLKNKGIFIDLLVNNAGFGLYGNFKDEPYEKTYRMNMLNVAAVASMCHLFIPPMIEKKAGGVINIASTASFQPVPYEANYAATKAYVLSFSLGLYEELREKGIMVSALCPGFTETQFAAMAGIPECFDMRAVPVDTVVRDGIDGFLKKKPIVVPKAHKNFAQFTLAKFMPIKLKLKIIGEMFKPRNCKKD